MRDRYPALTMVIVLLSLLLLVACGGRRDADSTAEDEVQSAVATGIAATQTAERVTGEAEVAIAQAVEATVTALAIEAGTADAAVAETTTGTGATNPTPTPTPDPTEANPTQESEPSGSPAATSTPTAPALVIIPFEFSPDQAAPTPPAVIVLPGGGSGDGMEGIITTQPELISFEGKQNTPVFSRAISLQMIVRILDEGVEDGAGIERVEIEVVDDDGYTVYAKTENSASYCLFGGGAPTCPLMRLRYGATWPGTYRPIEDGRYTAFFTVIPEDSSIEYGEWQQDFEVRTSGYGTLAEETDVRTELVQTEQGGTARTVTDDLVFQVTVADLARGKDDGDGIDYVVMGIIGPDGRQVYAKREDNAAYCAFGGDVPCPAWDFAKNDGRWPDGEPIRRGRHILRIIAVTESGKSQVYDWSIEIQ
jgi:hypothetical protein